MSIQYILLISPMIIITPDVSSPWYELQTLPVLPLSLPLSSCSSIQTSHLLWVECCGTGQGGLLSTSENGCLAPHCFLILTMKSKWNEIIFSPTLCIGKQIMAPHIMSQGQDPLTTNMSLLRQRGRPKSQHWDTLRISKYLIMLG